MTAPISFDMNVPFRISAPGWLVSLIVHLSLLVLLGICCFRSESPPVKQLLTALAPADLPEIDNTPLIQPIANALLPSSTLPGTTLVTAATLEQIETELNVENLDPVEVPAIVYDPAPPLPGGTIPRMPPGGNLERRDPARRHAARSIGANDRTEAGVAAGLKWLAVHQRPDGSWSFDHRSGPCKTNPGGLADAYNGATGLGILPFLGAGQTHKEGAYKSNIKAGLGYLIRNMKLREGKLGDLTDSGNMYSHGISTIALCEAYAMTNDKDLIAPAQAAINYIVYAQDPIGGGWRYAAKQAGDTSVVGWQLMALKSAHMAYLTVPPATVKGTSQFLDSVQVDSGSAYGYTSPGDSQATTSVGLLCRMHLGWRKDHGALERGVERLAKIGPSKNNLYYNYYATQVMLQHGGDRWKAWNKQLSEQLVATQSTAGAEAGSWYIPGDHGSDRGGRVYCTSMATMILEVYYRIQPLYQKDAAEEEFPL